MGKLTREQYNKWNAQAKNGFQLDLQYFLIWGEKTLIKDIKQESGCIIRFKLYYMPEYETVTNEYGCKWNERTGRQIPMMKIDKLIPGNTKGVYVVHSIRYDIPMGEAEKTMKYATLCKISGEVNTAEELKAIAE